MNRTTVDNMLPGRGAAAGTLNGSARQWGTEFGTMFLREPQLPKNNRKNNRVPFNWGTARRPRPRGASSRRLKHGRPHLSRRRKVPEDRGHGGGGRQGREPCRWRCGPWFGVVVAVLLFFFLPMHLGGLRGGVCNFQTPGCHQHPTGQHRELVHARGHLLKRLRNYHRKCVRQLHYATKRSRRSRVPEIRWRTEVL